MRKQVNHPFIQTASSQSFRSDRPNPHLYRMNDMVVAGVRNSSQTGVVVSVWPDVAASTIMRWGRHRYDPCACLCPFFGSKVWQVLRVAQPTIKGLSNFEIQCILPGVCRSILPPSIPLIQEKAVLYSPRYLFGSSFHSPDPRRWLVVEMPAFPSHYHGVVACHGWVATFQRLPYGPVLRVSALKSYVNLKV